MKTCSNCKAQKLKSEFGSNKARGDGLNCYCRDCWTALTRSHTLKRKYGITQEVYDSVLKRQEFSCAICNTQDFGSRGPFIDHDHETGQVRAILCNICNLVIGHVENGWMVEVPVIIDYIQSHKQEDTSALVD